MCSSGRLDNATRELMRRSRCGLPDIATDNGRFAFDGNIRISGGRVKRYVAGNDIRPFMSFTLLQKIMPLVIIKRNLENPSIAESLH